MKVSEILEKAADLIEPEGCWIQKQFADGHGFCAYAAIGNIAGEDTHLEKAQCYDAIYRVIGPQFLSKSICEWNDVPERTQAEVVTALRQAASIAKEQESR